MIVPVIQRLNLSTPAESSAGHTCLTPGVLVLKLWIMIDVLNNNNNKNNNNNNNNNNDNDNDNDNDN